MNINCPYCGSKFKLNITAESGYNREESIVVEKFFNWLKWSDDQDCSFIQIDSHKFSYDVKVLDSPDGDVWVNGIFTWIPGKKLEFGVEK